MLILIDIIHCFFLPASWEPLLVEFLSTLLLYLADATEDGLSDGFIYTYLFYEAPFLLCIRLSNLKYTTKAIVA